MASRRGLKAAHSFLTKTFDKVVQSASAEAVVSWTLVGDNTDIGLGEDPDIIAKDD